MPDQRRWSAEWTINVPSIAAIFGMIAIIVGGLLAFDRRQSAAEEQIKMQQVISNGIKEHIAASEEVAIRDRAELREDVKEIKATVYSIAVVQKRGR